MIELFSLGATVVKPKGDSLWLDYSMVPKYVTLDLYWEHRRFEGEHFSINGLRGYLIDWRDANAHGCLLYTDSGVVEQVNTYLKSLRKIGMPGMRAWWSEHGLQRSGYCHFDASLIQGDEWQR